MPSLRLISPNGNDGGHGSEIFGCAYTPDEAFLLSAGWDGYLRLWEAGQGAKVNEIHVGPKPLSACAVLPDGSRWVSGSMDGMLTQWDAVTQNRISTFLAHTRPISAIVFGADVTAATASWDGKVIVWNTTGKQWEGRTLSGHRDIVSGCRFSPDGKTLVSWSYDRTIRIWEVARYRSVAELTGHDDRITAGGVCPSGKWLASGSRNHVLKLWDLKAASEVKSVTLQSEVRACLFPLDGESLVTVEANGRIVLHSLPDLEQQAELATRQAWQCADLTASGSQLAVGSADGMVRFVAVEGLENVPLLVTPTQKSTSPKPGLFGRFRRKGRVTHAYHCRCPVCRQSFELADAPAGQTAPCPHCSRGLRIGDVLRTVDEAAPTV